MSTKLYLGHLPRADERDIEHFFKGFGRIVDIKVMTGFGFIEFEDSRDARDAVNELNGKTLLGERISVEYSRSNRDRRGGDDDRRGGYDDRRPYERREPRYARPKRTGFRAIVEGLAPSVSWQDLKDFARTAGEVTFADCHKEKEGLGAVEYEIETDLTNAIEKLDGQELKGSVVTVRADPDATAPPEDSRAPYGSRDGRSRSPARRPPPRRSPSPYGRRDDRRRSPSPYGRRRSPSPYARRRSPSPYRRPAADDRERSPPPRRRDDY